MMQLPGWMQAKANLSAAFNVSSHRPKNVLLLIGLSPKADQVEIRDHPESDMGFVVFYGTLLRFQKPEGPSRQLPN